MARVVVVGSGLAGLTVALRAARRHEVTLVTKAELAESNTRYAQGGVAVALFPDDSVAAHVADTLVAGAGLCDPDAVAVLCGEGPARVRELIELGVPFDRESGQLARGHEAAHSARRVIHAGGDATGLAIESTLVAAVRRAPVTILEHTALSEVLVAQGRVTGVLVLDAAGERRLEADAVVIASGGAGQLYRHTTNPAVTTGDGIAAAWRAGAELDDLEFVQFHPTALCLDRAPGRRSALASRRSPEMGFAPSSSAPLISEAVRGEGAVLRDAAGRRFMLEQHPDAELAPRDVVARGIARTMAAQGGAPVLLDATGIGRERLVARFPSLTALTAQHGFDWAAEPVPVTPAAHYLMGGIRTDLWGRTTVPGLFAVGEAACTGAHGANRLASNSLLEALVFAARCAEVLGDEGGFERGLISIREAAPRYSIGGSAAGRAGAQSSHPAGRVGAQRRIETPLAPFARRELQQLMWRHAGLERTEAGLREAAATLAGWHAAGEGVQRLEDANLLDLARLLVDAALAREESVGAHYRTDATTAVNEDHRELELAG